MHPTGKSLHSIIRTEDGDCVNHLLVKPAMLPFLFARFQSGYNPYMSAYKFLHPIEVRYGDLDPQGHVNNARHLTYFEQARVQYLIELGLFGREQSFMEVGVVIADIHIRYHAPIHYHHTIQAGVRTVKIGNKSIIMEQCLLNAGTQEQMASGTVVMVTFDYQAMKSIQVPENWKNALIAYENISTGKEKWS